MTELYIEKNQGSNVWVKLELLEDTQLELNFVRADVDDLQNRNSNFSQSIEIPGTQNNRKAFEQVYNIDKYVTVLTDTYLNKLFNCEYVLDGIHFVGIMELDKVSVLNETGDVTFHCSIRSNSILIKERIGDKFLRSNVFKSDDLDFSSYKHVFNITNIKNSWLTGVGTGYFYPIINYDNYGKTNNIMAMSQRPALYAFDILTKIFEKAGLTFNSNFFSTNEFRKILHPWVGKSETDEDDLKSREFRAGFQASTINTGTLGWNTNKWKKERILFNNDNAVAPLNFYDNGTVFFTSNGTNLIKKPGMYRFDLQLSVKPVFSKWQRLGAQKVNINSYSDMKASVILKRGSSLIVLGSTTNKYVPIQGKTMVVNNLGLDTLVDQIITITVATEEMQFFIGDEIYTEFEWNNYVNWISLSGAKIPGPSISYQYQKAYPDGTAASVFLNDAIQANKIFLGETMDPARGLPEKVKQYDYFKSIMNMFNLVIREDTLNPTNFFIEPRKDVIGTGKTYDWDYKVDNNEIIDIKRIPTLINKNVSFEYKLDDDFYNNDYKVNWDRSYGSYIKLNQQVTSDNYVIDVLFSQTPHYLHNNSKVIIPQMYTVDNLNKNVYGEEYNMRVLYRTDINTISNNNFKNYAGIAPFSIYLVGDPIGIGKGKMRITNQTWYSIADIGLTYKTHIIPTANHFEDPYNPTTNDLNFGYQKTYYAKTPSTYPTVNNLYNRFWSDYIEDVIDVNSKMITLLVKLSAQEIYDLSFDDIITYAGQKWIINKINNWSLDTLCSVELLKIS